MFCSYCGKRIADDARFCSFCGRGVVGVTQVQQNTEQPYAPETASPVVEYPTAPELIKPVEEHAETLDNPIDILSSEQQISIDISAPIPSGEPVVTENYSVSESVSEQQIFTARQISDSEKQDVSEDLQTQAPDLQGSVSDITQISESQIPQQPAFTNPQAQAPEQQGSVSDIARISESQIPQQSAFTNPQTQAPEQQGLVSDIARIPESQIPQQVAFTDSQTQAPERKYTAVHLILCLASTAVFAIAAGVFAGLYFAGL